MTTDVEVAIIGAGPFGLTAAAHLRAAGRETQVFGDPLEFWRTRTPRGMLLRSPYAGSNLDDPEAKYSLEEYQRQTGIEVRRPIPLDTFLDYGAWFQQHAVPDVDTRNVVMVRNTDNRFRIDLGDATLTAQRVVVAAGVGSFAHVPPPFDIGAPDLVSHTLDEHDLGRWADRRVLVVGGGQSALESAALLHEAGADVTVVVRQPVVHWLAESGWKHTNPIIGPLLYAKPDVGPMLVSHMVAHPRQYSRMPRRVQDRLAIRAIRPAGAGWLRPRLDDVPIRVATCVTHLSRQGDRLSVATSDGRREVVDRVLLGTGYRVDLSRYEFLDKELVARVRVVNRYPVLSRAFETSVPGLHITGAPAARAFGPLMRFVAGSEFAARKIARGIAP